MESRIEIRPGRTINLTRYINPEAEATLFLIHGLGGRSTQWRDQIVPLRKRYNLIIPDLYGHHKSDTPVPSGDNNPYSFSEIYKDLDVLFNQYAGKNNMIFGHSYGGAFATALCFNHQDTVRKLVLIAPTPCAPSIKVPFIYNLPLAVLNFVRPVLEKQFIKLAFNKTTNQDLIKVEIEASRKNPIYLIKYLIKGMATIPRLDMRQLRTPTLLIMGMNDLLVPVAYQEQFYRAIPDLAICRIDDAAHLVMLEQPEKVNEAIA